MFYAAQLVSRDGPLQVLWVAATLDRQLNRQLVDGTAIPRMVEVYLAPDAPGGIFSSGPHGRAVAQGGRHKQAGRSRDGRHVGEVAEDSAPLALRLSGQLLLGVCRIYSRKVTYLLQDCERALLVLKNICPADAPLAYGNDEEGDGESQERHRTQQHGGGEMAAGRGGDGRRTAKQRRKTAVSGAAAAAAAQGAAVGPDEELRMLPYDEDEILLSGAGPSQGPGRQGAFDLAQPGLGRAGSLGDDCSGGAGPSSGLPFATPDGSGSFSLRDPWSTPWANGGAGVGFGGGGPFTVPHPAATDDRHAYFDDEMPDHFEFDLDEHEIEALRAASHDLDPGLQQQPTASSPFATPPPLQQLPPGMLEAGVRPEQQLKQPVAAAEDVEEEEEEMQELARPSALGDAVMEVHANGGAGEGHGNAVMRGLEEGAEQSEEEQAHEGRVQLKGFGGRSREVQPDHEGLAGGGRDEECEEEQDPEGHCEAGQASGLGGGGPVSTGGYGTTGAAADDNETLCGVSGREADTDGDGLADDNEAGSAGAAPAAAKEDVQMAGIPGQDGEAKAGGSIPGGGSLADPETLPRGGMAGTSAGAPPRPPLARSVAVLLPDDAPLADGAQTSGGAPSSPTTPGSGGRRRSGGHGGDGTPRVCVDVEREGRVKTALSSHSVRELLQDRRRLIDNRRRTACHRRRTLTAAAASGDIVAVTSVRDAQGSPWLFMWGRLTGAPVRPATAATASVLRGCTRAHDTDSHNGPFLAQRPLNVASGPATLPAAALAAPLQHLFRFLGGPAGSSYCDQLPHSHHLDGQHVDLDQAQGKGQGGSGRAGVFQAEKPGKIASSGRPRSQNSAPSSPTAAAAATATVSGATAAARDEGDVNGGVVSSGAGGSGSVRWDAAFDGLMEEGEGLPSQDLVPPDAQLPDLDKPQNLVMDSSPVGVPLGNGVEGQEVEEEEGEEGEEEEEEELIDEMETGGEPDYLDAGDDQEADATTGDEETDNIAEATRRRRHTTDGFTARTQAVLQKLQAMVLSTVRRTTAGRAAKRQRLWNEAARAPAGAEDNSSMQTTALTTAAELLVAVADVADPAAAARRRTSMATVAAIATEPATSVPANNNGRSGGGSHLAPSLLQARVSRMAAARTFYDLLVLSNRGYISLVTQGSEAGPWGAEAAEVAASAGGGSTRASRSSTRAFLGDAHRSGDGCEELVVVARRRLQEQSGARAMVAAAPPESIAAQGGWRPSVT